MSLARGDLFEKEVTTVRLLEDELPEEIESHLSKGSIKACSKEEDQDEIKSGSQKNYKSESKNSNSSRKNDSLKNEKNDEYGLNQVPALRITSLDGEDKGLNKTKNPKNVKMSKKSQKNKKCSSAEERGNNEGLSFISGEIRKIPHKEGLRLPHIGWNEVTIKKKESLFKNIYIRFVLWWLCYLSEL